MLIQTSDLFFLKTSNEVARKQTKQLYITGTLQNHMLLALVAQLCVQTERSAERGGEETQTMAHS